MPDKSSIKTILPKKSVVPEVLSKYHHSDRNNSEKLNQFEIIEIHKHLLQIEKIINSLQKELNDIRRLISHDNGGQIGKNPVIHIAKVSPATTETPEITVQAKNKPRSVRSKALAVQTSEKTTRKSTVQTTKSKSADWSGRKKAHTPIKDSWKKMNKRDSKASFETLLPIPKDFPDRINALTSQKKITQTQFGKEADLSQMVIYEISERKLKEINPFNIWKIANVLKKYEAT